MKNLNRLLISLVAILAPSLMANIMQPAIQSKEEEPVRITAGVKGGMHNDSLSGKASSFGMQGIMGGLGFSHNLGYDFEYAVSGVLGVESYDKLFSDHAKEHRGLRADVELLTRYMPEVADGFNLGAVIGIGWGHTFMSKESQFAKASKQVNFGDLAFKVGPAISLHFSESVAAYFSPSYTLKNIRWHKEGTPATVTKYANRHGFEAPFGFLFSVADSTGFYIEANPMMSDLDKKDNFKVEATLGLSFSI